jgi:hypothetical protein
MKPTMNHTSKVYTFGNFPEPRNGTEGMHDI